MTVRNASGPLKGYRTLPQVCARLEVLYAKAGRIVAYNESLDPSVLDEKQLVTMVEKRRVLGVDTYPSCAFSSLRRTIDYLEGRRRALARQQFRLFRQSYVIGFDPDPPALVSDRGPSLWQRLTRRTAA